MQNWQRSLWFYQPDLANPASIINICKGFKIKVLLCSIKDIGLADSRWSNYLSQLSTNGIRTYAYLSMYYQDSGYPTAWRNLSDLTTVKQLLYFNPGFEGLALDIEKFPSHAVGAEWHTDFATRYKAVAPNLPLTYYDDSLPLYGAGWPTDSQWIAKAKAADVITMQCFGPSVKAIIAKEAIHGGDTQYPNYGAYGGTWYAKYGGRAQYLEGIGQPFTIGIEIGYTNQEKLQYANITELGTDIKQLDDYYTKLCPNCYYGLTIQCTQWDIIRALAVQDTSVIPKPPETVVAPPEPPAEEPQDGALELRLSVLGDKVRELEAYAAKLGIRVTALEIARDNLQAKDSEIMARLDRHLLP
jgi:hypothetical protein